jgi:hypothetical protein
MGRLLHEVAQLTSKKLEKAMVSCPISNMAFVRQSPDQQAVLSRRERRAYLHKDVSGTGYLLMEKNEASGA